MKFAQGLREGVSEASESTWSHRAGVVLWVIVGCLLGALVVVGGLAALAALWRVVRWGFGV